jgi:transcriptional regulator with XRE-family HTH domain
MNLRIKEIAKEKEITIKELATTIDLTPSNLSKLINGKSKPSIAVFEKIAIALKVDMADLFERKAEDVITCPKCGQRFKMIE